ncbi:16S rRNA (guanine(527)-N(7))-methyltransferase RsmG [bacterium]|nr:16S rRNA (guanine(527)-N(7))-methyltransferase RsmG [bacterium]
MTKVNQAIHTGLEVLRQELNPKHPEFEASVIECLTQYLALLSEWNPKVDLVAPNTTSYWIEHHLLDSAAAGIILEREFGTAASVLDIGSGAGLPGLIIAILNPKRRVILVEPRAKRVSFLKEARRVLALAQLEVVEKRLEDLGQEFRGIDLAIHRALKLDQSALKALKEILVPSGKLLSMESETQASPVDAPVVTSLVAKTTHVYTLPSGIRRRISVQQRMSPTSSDTGFCKNL